MSISYAYIISITFDPAAATTIAAMYRENTAPLIAQSSGLVVLLGLIQPHTGRGFSIRAWSTAAERSLTDVPSQAVVDDLATYAPILTGTYTRDPYEITINTLPQDNQPHPNCAVARVTTQTIHPARWDEGLAALRSVARSGTPDRPDDLGMLLFENRAISRAILLEIARSREHLTGQTLLWDEHDLRAHASGYLTTPTNRDVYDVVAWY